MLKDYRNQGLCAAVANQLFERCMARGYEMMAMSHSQEFDDIYSRVKPVGGKNQMIAIY